MLDKVKILIVDSDIHLARIVTQNLRAMNFTQVHHRSDTLKALDYLTENKIDLLITEWSLMPLNGLELVRHIRLGQHSLSKTLPIIMLTGKGELADVTMARDVGITEFVVKPFSAKTLYSRIENSIEHPRSFIVSENFIGPDRRRKIVGDDLSEDRRRQRPKLSAKQNNKLPEIESVPLILAPELEIKNAIGLHAALSSIVTPDMLALAQKEIDNMKDESLQWIREDIAVLEKNFADVVKVPKYEFVEEMKASALSIKSRAGMFGYGVSSEIARMLYLFLCSSYVPSSASNNESVRQCIEALKITFIQSAGTPQKVWQELIKEVQLLFERQGGKK